MMHLTDDEIFDLAQITEDFQIYSSLNLQQMEHLKTCESCYRIFCSALAVLDMTSESGYMFLSGLYGMDAAKKVSPASKILAVVQIAREKIKESASAVIRQVEQAGTVFKFTPVLAAAVRGNRETNPEIFRAEDVDDEKTFIVFDAGKRELMIQINRAKLEAERVRVYLCFDNSETIEVSLEEKGKYLRGVLRDISDQDFQIRVERL